MTRQPTQVELFTIAEVTQSNLDHFRVHNTSPLGEAEQVDGEWVFVYPIRYGGSQGRPNSWGL